MAHSTLARACLIGDDRRKKDEDAHCHRGIGCSRFANGTLPDFPAVIRNLPLPQEKKEQEGVQYSQTRSASGKLSDGCFYWTSADFDSTKARIRDYLRSSGFTPEEMSRSYVGRVYSYFFARSGDRFLRVEVMLESNRQVAVDARLLAPSEIEHDYPLREALRITEMMKPPQSTVTICPFSIMITPLQFPSAATGERG